MQNTSTVSQSPVLFVDGGLNHPYSVDNPATLMLSNFNAEWLHTSTRMRPTAQIFKVLDLQPLLALTPSLSQACCLLLVADERLNVDLGLVRVRAPKESAESER
jgi:hypothetical protein